MALIIDNFGTRDEFQAKARIGLRFFEWHSAEFNWKI